MFSKWFAKEEQATKRKGERFVDALTRLSRLTTDLANERTYLAWIRTALALLAGGIAVEAFGVLEDPFGKGVAILLLLLGMFVSGGAFMRWVGVERAMRHRAALPLPLIAPVLGIGAAAGALVVIIVIALE